MLGARLDAPPPPPASLGQQQPSMDGLAGPQGNPSGDGALQKAVMEKMMMAEKSLQDAAGIMPELAPVISDITQQLRAKAGKIVLASAQPQQEQSGVPQIAQLLASANAPGSS